MPFLFEKLIPLLINLGLALILLSPLPFGNVETWSVSLFEIVSFLTFGLWLTGKILKGRIRIPKSPLYLPMALFFLLIFFQTVQLPEFLLGIISPHTSALFKGKSEALAFVYGEKIHLFSTISIYPFVTNQKFLLYLSYAAFFIVAFDYIRTGRQVRRFFWVIFTVCLIESLIGLMQYIASGSKVPASGTYVNPNHFAGLLVLVIPFILGYLLYLYTRHGVAIGRWGGKVKLPVSSHFVMFFATAIMAITLILAQSRGAILSFGASIFFFYVLMSRDKKNRSNKWLIGGFLAIILVYSLWIGLDPVLDKATKTTRELPKRTYIWKDSLNMIKDFPVLGVGLGNFSLAYTLYKKDAYWPHVYDHAHNDYIELATETGIVGFALVFWALISFFRNVYRSETYFSSVKDPFSYFILIGLLSGMFGMFLHTITEFTFQIPANAYYFTFILALTARLSEPKNGKTEMPER